MARRYQHVVKNITLDILTAYPAERPVGALRRCHVHAEVQLILHYEQHFPQRPPRAIGCSKSACFLCDSLIQKLGQYRISYAHRRLYNQWTIPDVSWITSKRAHYFKSVIENMIADMVQLAGTRRAQLFRPFGLESRAVLPY